MNDELPQGWVRVSFMDAFDIQGGTQPPKDTFKYAPAHGYVRLLQIRDFGERPVPTFISSRLKLKTCQKEDILIGRYGASVGRICTGMEGAYNVALTKVIIPERLSRRYVFWLLQSPAFQRPLLEIERSAQNGFNKEDLDEILLPLAPLSEQRRIAAKLDKLLSQVDLCQKRLTKLPALLKRFRQAVLSDACSGRLTADWREENPVVESGLELLRRVLLERKRLAAERTGYKRKSAELREFDFDTDTELPSSWAKAKLDNLIYIAGRIGWRGLKAEEYTQTGPMLLSVFNLNDGENVSFGKVNRLSNERYEESPEIKVEAGDILLAKDGAGIGKIGYIAHLPEQATLNSSLLLIRALEAFVPKYLFYFLSGPELQNIAKARITGSATPHLFQKDIREFFLSVPPLIEQQEIVRRVEKLFALADRLEARFIEGQKRVDGITQSLLAKAFRGELVPTEFELAKAEGRSFESAEELLERVKGDGDRADKGSKASATNRGRRRGAASLTK